MNNLNREGWLKGDRPGEDADEFARHAARGREELGSEEDARELMNELDGMFAARFGEAKEDANVRDSVGTKEIPLPGKAKARVRRLGRYYAAAAAILLLVAAGSWWVSQQDTVGPETLYAEAFSPYANDLSTRTMGGDEPSSLTDLDRANLAYDRRDFATAAEGYGRYLTALSTSNAPAPAPEKVRLYQGISLLAANQPEAAISTLEALLNDPANGPPAAWYRALAQVRLGRLAEARTALTTIANNENSPFSKKAERLLRNISL